jgi:hypothetical protein
MPCGETHMLINQHKGERKCHSCESRNPETKELDSRLHGNDGLGVFSEQKDRISPEIEEEMKESSHFSYIKN